jgi:hypothetical protein
MQWPREVSVEEVRDRYADVAGAFVVAELGHLMSDRLALLSIALDRPEFWEATAQIIGYGSRSGVSPGELWNRLAVYGGVVNDDFYASIANSTSSPQDLVETARLFLNSFTEATLEQITLAVTNAVASWDSCKARCTNNDGTLNHACVIDCLLEN